jgi:hypothetical protein
MAFTEFARQLFAGVIFGQDAAGSKVAAAICALMSTRPKDDLMATQNEIESDEVYEKYLSRYFPYYPLIAATIAVSFDVGCFYAIDISFFTLFSLSEHIVFALEALPVALAGLFIITILLPAMLSRSLPIRPSTITTRNQKAIAIVVLATLLGSLTFFLVYALYTKLRRH